MKTKALFITLISGFLLFPWLSQAQVTLAVQDNAPGYRGSYNNSVSVSLTNNADKVSRVQVDICDVDNLLTIFDCATTSRSRDGFSCQAFDLPSGCARVILSSPGGIITEGTGAILTLKYIEYTALMFPNI